MAVLGEALDRVASGQAAVVLIDGEAGIGKTRLLAEAMREARYLGDPVFLDYALKLTLPPEPALRFLDGGPPPDRPSLAWQRPLALTPFGRRLLSGRGRAAAGRGRPESAFDPEAVFTACRDHGVAIEINCRSPADRPAPPSRTTCCSPSSNRRATLSIPIAAAVSRTCSSVASGR